MQTIQLFSYFCTPQGSLRMFKMLVGEASEKVEELGQMIYLKHNTWHLLVAINKLLVW